MTQRQTQSQFKSLLAASVAIFAVCICSVANAADSLASWNEGPAKKAILEREKGSDPFSTFRIADFKRSDLYQLPPPPKG